MRKNQHQTLPSEYYYNERCKMTKEEQRLIIYLTRWNRTETMKLMRELDKRVISKKEFQKELIHTNEVLTSALEVICAKYGIVPEKEGEELYMDIIGKECEDLAESIKNLMRWDKCVIDTEDEEIRKC